MECDAVADTESTEGHKLSIERGHSIRLWRQSLDCQRDGPGCIPISGSVGRTMCSIPIMAEARVYRAITLNFKV